MGTVVLVGTCFTDIKGFPAGQYDPVGRNIGVVEEFSGGVARNVAINISNMGYVVRFVSMVDSAETGDKMLEELRGAGADVSCVLRPETGGSGIWLAVFDEKGEVRASISQQPDLGLMEQHIRSLGKRITDNADAMILEIDLNEEIAEYCFDVAEESGIPVYAIVGNLKVARRRIDLLTRCRCFICNKSEACDLFQIPNGADGQELADAVAYGSGRIGIPQLVVTLGEAGALWYEQREERTGCVPARKPQIIDTTGAGDAFFSACVCALLEGRALGEACIAGTALASDVISRKENACRPCPGFISKRLYL